MHTIAYLAPEYGALTSTFIYREVQALRDLGFQVQTFSTLRPKETVVSDEARAEAEATTYLYDLPKPQLLAEAAAAASRQPARFVFLEGQAMYDGLEARVGEWKDRPKLFWHFIIGCALAGRLRRAGAEHLHAHFAHVPTSIAMYAAAMAGIPFSFTCHANDIFQRGVALKEKVKRSAFTACISEYNVRFLTELGCAPEKLTVVRCGINVGEYAYREPQRSDGPFTVFSVGRLIEKKGMEYLIAAVGQLRSQGMDVRCRIAGNGPLEAALRTQAAEAGLENAVDFLGSQPQERVRELLREADAFALACVEAANKDLDGIPVSLMEAMAMGVPVVSTGVSGIPELIHDGENGLLAAPRDAISLASALERLMNQPGEAQRFTVAARKTVESEFEQVLNAQRLKQQIEDAIVQRRTWP